LGKQKKNKAKPRKQFKGKNLSAIIFIQRVIKARKNRKKLHSTSFLSLENLALSPFLRFKQ